MPRALWIRRFTASPWQMIMKSTIKSYSCMRKILSFFTFSGKAFLLILLLIVGWTFVNVSNLFKGGKSQKGDDVTGLFLPDDAHADATTTSCILTTCPHVAVFDGHAFKIENDFFQKSFHTDYFVARSRYERGEMPPDLLRFGAVPRMRDGRIALQLQKIEPEESFIDKVQLMRVIHSMTSEIIPSNVSGKLYAFERADLEHTTALPSRAVIFPGLDDWGGIAALVSSVIRVFRHCFSRWRSCFWAGVSFIGKKTWRGSSFFSPAFYGQRIRVSPVLNSFLSSRCFGPLCRSEEHTSELQSQFH